MRILPFLVILMFVFLFYRESFAQETLALGDAEMELANLQVGNGLGAEVGANGAKEWCGNPTGMMMCVVMVGGGIESIMGLMNAKKSTQPTIDALKNGDYKGLCESDPQLCKQLNYDPFKDPKIVSAIDNLKPNAQKFGVNLDDPKSMQKFLTDHAADLAPGGAGEQAMANLSPVELARLDQIKKDAASKFNISSVGFDEGGGGGGLARRGGGHGGSNLDFSKLLGGLNGADKKDDAASGLQRKLASGEPVGVASDDIFKTISRRYQTKIQAKTFRK